MSGVLNLSGGMQVVSNPDLAALRHPECHDSGGVSRARISLDHDLCFPADPAVGVVMLIKDRTEPDGG
jgi:hypothetical protein